MCLPGICHYDHCKQSLGPLCLCKSAGELICNVFCLQRKIREEWEEQGRREQEEREQKEAEERERREKQVTWAALLFTGRHKYPVALFKDYC